MTTEEINEGNKLIEQFVLGDKWIEVEYQSRGIMNKNYHSSWEWQIPVWQKLYSILSKKNKWKKEAYHLRYEQFNNLIHFTPMQAFELFLVPEIKWYNKNKKL